MVRWTATCMYVYIKKYFSMFVSNLVTIGFGKFGKSSMRCVKM